MGKSRALVLLLASVLATNIACKAKPPAGPGAVVAGRPAPARPPDYGAWSELLLRALSHRTEDRAFISAMQATPPSQACAKLATVLLEEWDFDPHDPRLEGPRAVDLPPVTKEQLDLERTAPNRLLVVKGTVTKDGFVEEAAIVHSGGAPRLDRLYLERLLAMRFRPAREGMGYVARPSGLTLQF